MKKKNFLQDENAVSEVLGFMLIMGILISATTIYLSIQVPEWTKEFEAEHASKVPHDFAKLSSNIDMAILSEDPTASAATPIGMRPESVPLIGIFASGGTVSFEPHGTTMFVIACAPSAGGIPPGPPVSGNWNTSSNTPTDNFSIYDKYHVTVVSTGVRLELSEEKDKNFSSGGTEYYSGNYWLDEFIVTSNTTVVVSTLKIRAKTITIDAGSKITADGMGGAGGAFEKNGTGLYNLSTGENGFGLGVTVNSTGGGGAGYGGDGGAGGNNTGSGGSSYGNATNQTVEVGSGGGGGGNGYGFRGGEYKVLPGGYGGPGGGYIWLEAQNITIKGTISANGSAGEVGINVYKPGVKESASGGGGGGSGGGIMIKGDNVTITTGMLYAVGGYGGAGGDGNSSNPSVAGSGGGGGAGGRIKVFYDSHYPGDITSYASAINGSGGAGGIAEKPENEGENGNHSDSGTLHNESRLFTMRYPHYVYGTLTSNLTAIEEHIGNDTRSTTTRYGIMTWDATTDPGLTFVTMKVRTSINANMSGAMDWDDDDFVAATNGSDISDLPSVSDGHRYIQWRAELSTNDPYETPVLHAVNVSYEYGGSETPTLVNPTGNIEFRSQYIYLPNYKLSYEHGATIKNQTEGGFMLLSPPFSISQQAGGGTSLRITAVNLTGSERTISGGFSSTVKAYYEDADLVLGGLNFLNLTFNITTIYPTPWKKWFNETCEDAGLAYGTDPGNYYINETGNSVQVIFYGNESRPVNLWLKSAEVKIKIK